MWDRLPGRHPERDAGHALNGPIAIRGAKKGMTLVIHIETIKPGPWGWNWGVDWRPARKEPEGLVPRMAYFWDIDPVAKTARNQLGQVVAIKPFMGVLGMPPDEEGWLTLGFDPDLNQAYEQALWAMIDLMTDLYDITRVNALSLASLIVDMRVTQRVNGTNGVHALLPHNAFTKER